LTDLRTRRDSRLRADSVLDEVVRRVAPLARSRLGDLEAVGFLARLEQAFPDAFEALDVVYGRDTATAALLHELVGVVLDAATARPGSLRALDRRREVDAGWFQRSRTIGYACYVDQFAGSLAGIRDRLDYLAELGVSYLHLMPLLAPRAGENDGGYAVADYGAVDPRLGTMADLQVLAEDMHGRGMSLCIDLVLNHTAREHDWATRASDGDPAYRDFYLVFPDRSRPEAYERALPEVFPDLAPGNFTFSPELGGWVWTTFHEFQWDLNYANPNVFRAMLGTMLDLANRGVDVLRLDAVPFLWKRLGTDCQNQPETHLLVQAFRALTRVAAPGLLFKAEAIVAPEMLVAYLGGHDQYRPECDLAYNNQLMVMLWSALAARDATLLARSMARLRRVPPTTSWVTYVRCHDDIGWAVSDVDAASVGWHGWTHRRFLSDFYAGRHPGSFARGALFQENPASGEARISGMAASLCGIETALASGDPAELDSAIRRLELVYSVVFSFGGIPLVWMGDEIALRNDRQWARDPARADDNRWMHRPPMDWHAAGRRMDPSSLEGRVFQAIRGLADARRRLLALRGGGETSVLPTDNPHVLAYRRRHQRSGPLLALASFSDGPESVPGQVLDEAGVRDPVAVHSNTVGVGGLSLTGGRVHLPAWGFVWVADQ
jgi:amylosucrase